MRHARANSKGTGQLADAAPLAQRVGTEVDRMREALDQLIEFSGMSRRVVERRLLMNDCGTDLNRLLSGKLDLKMRHVLAICRVIELEPLEFLQIALKPNPAQRSPLLRRLEALLPYEAHPPAPRTTEMAALLRRAEDLTAEINDLMARETDRILTAAAGLESGTRRSSVQAGSSRTRSR